MSAPATLSASAPAAPDPAAPPAAALSHEHLQALQAARWEGRKVTRAAAVAAISGWTLVTFGALTLLTGLFSLPAILLGVALLVIARRELGGARRLRQFDVGAPVHLALNQVVLGVAMFCYGSWGMYAAITGPSRYEEQIATHGPAAAEILEPIADLHLMVSVAFYLLLIGAAVIGAGGTALYYATRRPHVAAFLRNTPAWVVETVRAVR